MNKDNKTVYTINHSIQFLKQGTIVCEFTSNEMEVDSIMMLACGVYKSGETIKRAFAHEKEQIEFELNEHLNEMREERASSFTCPDQIKTIVSIFEQQLDDKEPIDTNTRIEFEVTHEERFNKEKQQ